MISYTYTSCAIINYDIRNIRIFIQNICTNYTLLSFVKTESG